MIERVRRNPVVVVGYDGSEPSRTAVTVASRRAGPDGIVIVVHAYDRPPSFLSASNYDRVLSENKDHARALLDALPLTGDDELLDTEYETELVCGQSPAEAIAEVAEARHADEIVVGARGLGGIQSLLGSVSHALLRIADRPVLVVPPAAVDHVNRSHATRHAGHRS